VEREHPPGAVVRISHVPKYRLHTRALVGKMQWCSNPLDVSREPLKVLLRLSIHSAEGRALLLGLDDAYGLPVHEEHVVGEPRLQRKLAQSYATRGRKVQVFRVLDTPTCEFEHPINPMSGKLLGCSQPSPKVHPAMPAF
jgi:hypothetical protein